VKPIIFILALSLLAILIYFSLRENSAVNSPEASSIVSESHSTEEIKMDEPSMDTLPEDPQTPKLDHPLEKLSTLSDPTEISILVLESVNSNSFSMSDKKELLKASLSKSSRPDAQNLLETIISTNSDPQILAVAFDELARISSKSEMKELFDRLEIMSSYTEEKEQAIQEARLLHTRQN